MAGVRQKKHAKTQAAILRAARETGVRFIGRLADEQPTPFPRGTPLISDLRQLIV